MIRSSIEIRAAPSKVREVCLDFEKIPQWHTGLIESIRPFEGSSSLLKTGDKLHYVSQGRYAEPTVEVSSDSELRWNGSAFGGMLNASHFWQFTSSDQRPGWTTFVQGEDFSGMIGFLFSEWSPFGLWLRGKFDAFNRDLKARVEALPISHNPTAA